MNRHSIDFHGLVHLDPKIVEQLEGFLREREGRLAYQLLHAVELPPAEASAPVLPPSAALKLSEAVEGIGKKMRLASSKAWGGPLSVGKRDRALKTINSALWAFTEVLEGCIGELFEQVRQVPLNRWNLPLAQVVQSAKEGLMHRLEEVMWAVRRLEAPVKEYMTKIGPKSRRWFDWRPFEEPLLDPDLLKNLRQTEKFLKTEYEAFHRLYDDFTRRNGEVEVELEKLSAFPVLALLELSEQHLYVDLFRLLKLAESRPRSGKQLIAAAGKAIQRLSSVDRVSRMCRIYERDLKNALFKESLEWKKLHREGEVLKEDDKKLLQGRIEEYREEVRELIQILNRYRAFLLKNDSNPYIRSRWGFTEWIVGPEPVKAKKLLQMIYEVQELEERFTRFLASLTQEVSVVDSTEAKAREEIEHLLHEIGQPLISRGVMRNRIERLLEQLIACDEVGSPRFSTVHYVEEVLAKVMRADWKYHVLYEFPRFHQLYLLHKGLVPPVSDPAHAFRLDRFHVLLNQIKEWVRHEDAQLHIHEIEIDVNDMKTYLQDFLASVQRALKQRSHDPFPDETLHKLYQQLLEYRYLFGQFFAFLMKEGEGDVQLRNQFLFVDQYFESSENTLADFGNGKKRAEKLP